MVQRRLTLSSHCRANRRQKILVVTVAQFYVHTYVHTDLYSAKNRENESDNKSHRTSRDTLQYFDSTRRRSTDCAKKCRRSLKRYVFRDEWTEKDSTGFVDSKENE